MFCFPLIFTIYFLFPDTRSQRLEQQRREVPLPQSVTPVAAEGVRGLREPGPSVEHAACSLPLTSET